VTAVERLPLRHPRGVTHLFHGAGALAAAADELVEWLAGRRTFVVTTPVVWRLHGADLGALLAVAAGCEVLEVPEGEVAKTLAEAERLWQRMSDAGGKRDSRLLAFGGGSVGDLGGFVAGAFLRGIGCVQLPTTLLAQVDAAIGGKTAVDLPLAKNSVGLFHHPFAVVADIFPPAERGKYQGIFGGAFALSSVVGPLVDSAAYRASVFIAGSVWTAAFVLFVFVIRPVVVGPRVDGKPG